MSMTPVLPGTLVSTVKEDPNDPESSITALLWPGGTEDDADPVVLGWTQNGQDIQQFFWLVRSCAEFHGLQFQDDSGLMD